MNVSKKLLIASSIAGVLSIFGCGRTAPLNTQSVESQSSDKTAASDISDSDLRELARLLPEFIDTLQQRDDESEAALAMLAALRLDENPEVMKRNAPRISWAATVHGADRLKEAALLARDTEEAAVRSERTADLAVLLRLDEVHSRTDAILERIEQGQMPTKRQRALLTVWAEMMRNESPAQGGG